MAYMIHSDDMAVICLILADGDVTVRFRTVIQRAEAYQASHGDHFGVTDADFQNALLWLVLDGGLWPQAVTCAVDQVPRVLRALELREGLSAMLQYADVYFNDEGEHWYARPEPSTPRRQLLTSFLAGPSASDATQTRAFLCDHGWGADTLLLALESWHSLSARIPLTGMVSNILAKGAELPLTRSTAIQVDRAIDRLIHHADHVQLPAERWADWIDSKVNLQPVPGTTAEQLKAMRATIRRMIKDKTRASSWRFGQGA